MEIRERIIEEAAGLFKAYGIKMVTMDSLAAHLGISKRTIYELFHDKDELLANVLNTMSKKQKALIKSILDESENAIYAIFTLLKKSMEHFRDMSPAFRADLKKYHHEVFANSADKSDLSDYRNNIQVIERGIKEKLFRKEINAGIVNRCIYFLGASIMDLELYPWEEFPRSDLVKNVLINYLRGISTPEGLELISKLEAEF